VPSSLLRNRISCAFPDLVDPPIALQAIESSLEEPHFPLVHSDTRTTTTDSASTAHLGSNLRSEHGHVQLNGYVPAGAPPARPGNSIAPPFPSPTRKVHAGEHHNSKELRGSGPPGGFGEPVRWTGEAGGREMFSQALVFAWVLVAYASIF
jgi:hypothetical protein